MSFPVVTLYRNVACGSAEIMHLVDAVSDVESGFKVGGKTLYYMLSDFLSSKYCLFLSPLKFEARGGFSQLSECCRSAPGALS